MGQLDRHTLLGLEAASKKRSTYRHDHHGSADDADHHHDDSDRVVAANAPSREAVIAALQRWSKRTDYRVKGFAALPGAANEAVISAWERRFDSLLLRPARRLAKARKALVLIGDDLDQASCTCSFDTARWHAVERRKREHYALMHLLRPTPAAFVTIPSPIASISTCRLSGC